MFFDCNCYIGQPSGGGPASSAEELTAAMDRAGIAQALVWHVAQRDLDPLTGNDLLGRGIAGRQRLVGCWTILPPQTGELGRPSEWLARALAAGVRAFRAFPEQNRYLLRADAVGGLLELMIAARAPLIVSVGKQWQGVCDLLGELPELTVILSEIGCWGADRYFRPLIERYTNVHLDISDYMLDGGIEAFFRREVLPHVPDAWIDESIIKIGYEISFTRYFYKPQPLRTLEEIRADILALEKESEGLIEQIIGGGRR